MAEFTVIVRDGMLRMRGINIDEMAVPLSHVLLMVASTEQGREAMRGALTAQGWTCCPPGAPMVFGIEVNGKLVAGSLLARSVYPGTWGGDTVRYVRDRLLSTEERDELHLRLRRQYLAEVISPTGTAKGGEKP